MSNAAVETETRCTAHSCTCSLLTLAVPLPPEDVVVTVGGADPGVAATDEEKEVVVEVEEEESGCTSRSRPSPRTEVGEDMECMGNR